MRLHGRMKRFAHWLDQAPSLIMIGEKVRLSCPVEVRPPNYFTNKAIAQGPYLFSASQIRAADKSVSVVSAVS